MTTKKAPAKKAAPKAASKSFTDEEGAQARNETMKPDEPLAARGQTATVSKATDG